LLSLTSGPKTEKKRGRQKSKKKSEGKNEDRERNGQESRPCVQSFPLNMHTQFALVFISQFLAAVVRHKANDGVLYSLCHLSVVTALSKVV